MPSSAAAGIGPKKSMRDTSEEFRAAQEIQQRLYPGESPTLPGFDIAGALFPAKATAGDYFDYIPMLDGCLGVVLGDVSSHGMGPALLMSETRACLRTLGADPQRRGRNPHPGQPPAGRRRQRLPLRHPGDGPARSRAIVRWSTPAPASAATCWAPGIEATVLDSTSLPLGVRADTVVPAAAAIALQPGDLVTFFTDGVAEAESPGRVRFGVARALQIIRSEREKPAAEIIETLHQEVLGFCRSQPPQDDITIVVAKVT